jgi:hypothetical protein
MQRELLCQGADQVMHGAMGGEMCWENSSLTAARATPC